MYVFIMPEGAFGYNMIFYLLHVQKPNYKYQLIVKTPSTISKTLDNPFWARSDLRRMKKPISDKKFSDYMEAIRTPTY